MACFDSFQCLGESGKRSILYSILKNDKQPNHHSPSHATLAAQQHQACLCETKKVVLLSPQITCEATSAVLLKTLRFVKNVPCFRELPVEDQLQLVLSSWTPMLVLGMAQDLIDFETIEAPEPSMLQKILTSSRHGKDHIAHDQSVQGVPLTDVQRIKMFLNTCWGMDISTKEYAYLKGAILFNPDIAELQCQSYIQALQREAHQALNEYVKMVHRGDVIRFNKLFLALSMLRSINSNVVVGLFFKPVIGSVSMEDLLLQIFYR